MRLKYTGDAPFAYFDAVSNSDLRVSPGDVVDVSAALGSVLLRPAVGTFVVAPDVPDKPSARTPRGGIVEPA